MMVSERNAITETSPATASRSSIRAGNGVSATHRVADRHSVSAPGWLSAACPGPGTRFSYGDPGGENGPVTRAQIRPSPSGLLSIRADLVGRSAAVPLDVVPPNDGTDGFLVLEIGGGDRYCIKYGADGNVRNRGAGCSG
jgi:hypothetical protein